jgi:hypothetical protein
MIHRVRRVIPLCATLVGLLGAAAAAAPPPHPAQERPRVPLTEPAAAYRAACAACHGADGRGVAAATTGLDIPLPDFTDCSFATREPDADWTAIAHDGGPARAFDRRMPAFGEALDAGEIAASLEHVRSFCADPAWPRGELNLPRPLVTEKAYPEDEAVVTTTFDTSDEQRITNQFLYERRLGARTQYEVMVPFVTHGSDSLGGQHGLGDAAFAVKHVLAHSLRRGSIVGVTGEIVFPTGKESLGLGKGVTVFEPFVTAGQLLPGNSFLHVQAGAELPTDLAKAGREAFWRVALGRTFEQARFGRAWSPMVELLGARELASGERALWDIVPQVQVTLSRRQHVMINGGVRLPLNERGRSPQIITYLLWDWFDGGLTQGWR